MAIIYSYPTVVPTKTDLILGTDVSTTNKSTKNFTVQSIIDLVTVATGDLQTVLNLGNIATGKDIVLGTIGVPANTMHAGVFTTGPGLVVISNNTAIGFSNVSSILFTGNLTGRLLSTGLAAQIESGVQAVTQAANDNSTKIATTAYVDGIVDPSVLTFLGTTGGDQTVTLAAQKFSLLGTTSEIKTLSSAQTLTVSLADGAFGSGAELILPNGASATTQAVADSTVKVATTAFVKQENDAQDLDFKGDTAATGSVILGGGSAQVFNIAGTTDQVATVASNQKLTISLPTNVTIGGIFTGTTFAGDLLGTINTATTGVTQTAGDASTKIATTKYVDDAAGSKTLSYQADAAGAGTMPFTMNLSTDDLDIEGGSNINTSTLAVTAGADPKAVIKINLDNDVTISGTSKADTFTTTAGDATWVTTVLDGFTAITSDLFTGPLTGNADTATALASSGILSFGGEVTVSTSTPSPATYTSGGNITLNLTLNNAAVTGKVLTGLVVPASGSSVVPTDTILSGIGKLQAQVNTGATGLRFVGSWNASMDTGGTDNTPKGTPALTSGGGLAASGTNTSVNTPVDNKLIDGTASFSSTVTANDRVYNEAGAFTTITSIDSNTELTLADAIFLTTGQAYTIDNDPALSQGEYYVVSAVGASEARNATLNSIQNWQVGDWVISGANNVWERLDQTSVDGTGTPDRIPKWDTASSLNDSILLQNSDGIKIDTGKTLTTQGTGGNLIVGGAATITGLTTASAALSLTGGVNLPTGAYGAANQVLGNANAAGAAGNDLVWITPTVGTLTDVDAGTGITIDKTAPAEPVIAINYVGTSNAILSATDATEAILTTDQIWFNDVATLDPATINKIKKAPISSLPFNNYSWLIDADDASSEDTVTSGQEVVFTGTNGITTSHSEASGTHTVQIIGVTDPVTGTGTALTLPVWETGGATLGDSMVSQNQASGTILTIAASSPTLIIKNTSNATQGQVEIQAQNAGTARFFSKGITDVAANATYGGYTFNQRREITGAGAAVSNRNVFTIFADNTTKFAGSFAVGGNTVVEAFNTDNIKISGSSISGTVSQNTLLIDNLTGNSRFYSQGINASTKGTFNFNCGTSDTLGSTTLAIASTGVTVTGNVSLSDNILFSSVNASDSALILTNEGSTGVGAIFMQAGTGSGSGGGSVTCYANARAGGKDADVAVGLSDNSNGQFRINTSGVDVGTDVFTVSADGDTLITGDLTVDGNIIHGGGGSGTHTAKGGTFTNTVDVPLASPIVATEAFTIERTAGGTMVFDVYFTANGVTGQSINTISVAKKFTIVKQYGTSQATISSFKIFDTGPGTQGSNTVDFSPTFIIVADNKLKCMITPVSHAQRITCCIFLAPSETNATIVLN